MTTGSRQSCNSERGNRIECVQSPCDILTSLEINWRKSLNTKMSGSFLSYEWQSKLANRIEFYAHRSIMHSFNLSEIFIADFVPLSFIRVHMLYQLADADKLVINRKIKLLHTDFI